MKLQDFLENLYKLNKKNMERSSSPKRKLSSKKVKLNNSETTAIEDIEDDLDEEIQESDSPTGREFQDHWKNFFISSI